MLEIDMNLKETTSKKLDIRLLSSKLYKPQTRSSYFSILDSNLISFTQDPNILLRSAMTLTPTWADCMLALSKDCNVTSPKDGGRSHDQRNQKLKKWRRTNFVSNESKDEPNYDCNCNHEISYQWMKRVKDNVFLIVNDARRKKYTINEFRPAFGQLGGYDLYEKLTPFMLALALFHVGEFVLCLRGSYQISIKIL